MDVRCDLKPLLYSTLLYSTEIKRLARVRAFCVITTITLFIGPPSCRWCQPASQPAAADQRHGAMEVRRDQRGRGVEMVERLAQIKRVAGKSVHLGAPLRNLSAAIGHFCSPIHRVLAHMSASVAQSLAATCWLRPNRKSCFLIHPVPDHTSPPCPPPPSSSSSSPSSSPSSSFSSPS